MISYNKAQREAVSKSDKTLANSLGKTAFLCKALFVLLALMNAPLPP